jgi:DNA-binding transcriptional MerR regulator
MGKARGYTVSRLARLAGVSVRTLHHYDRIGLLRPTDRSAAGYRLYGEADLYRLQQVLFYRELDIPLERIRTILDEPGFDPLAALASHRAELEQSRARLGRLIETIDQTTARLRGEDTMLKDEELYEGFPEEKAEAWQAEAKARWGSTYEESNRRVRSWSKLDGELTRDEGADERYERRKAEALAQRRGRLLEVFEDLARQDSPFSPYPIIRVWPRR